MKKMFLLFVLAGSVVTGKAQLNFGAKAGLNVSNAGGSEVEGNKAKAGVYLGGFVQVPIAEKFSLQPELVFSTQGAKSEDDNDAKLNLNYLNVPVLAKYTHESGFFAETGPQFGLLLSAKTRGDGGTHNVKEDFRKLDFSWGLGIGYLSKSNIGVNARFNFGLSKLDEDGDFKAFNRVLQVGLFYVLGGAGK